MLFLAGGLKPSGSSPFLPCRCVGQWERASPWEDDDGARSV